MHNVLLEYKNVTLSYDNCIAVHQANFTIYAGEIVTLIGANGAGKTSILKSIVGLMQPVTGNIFFEGVDLKNLKSHEIVKKRLCSVPENRGIFLNLSVQENLELGAWTNPNALKDFSIAFEYFPKLKQRLKQNAGTLSGGEQQMLAIARALMANPKLLLLDEPSLGLAPQFITKIFEIISALHNKGITILLVEQNAVEALRVSQRGIVLENGKIVAIDQSKNLLASDIIQKAYLGGIS